MRLAGREITRFFMLRAPAGQPCRNEQKTTTQKIEKKTLLLKDVFNKPTAWAVLIPPKGLKHRPGFILMAERHKVSVLHLPSNYVILHQ